jgi:hypothetical protein
MGDRDYQVPESFIKAMSRNVKGFSRLSDKHQVRMAYYIWIAGLNRRQHKMFDGAMSIGYRELEKAFGRGRFKEINNRLQIFEVDDQWWYSKGATKAYRLSESVQEAKDKYLASKRQTTSRMMSVDGKSVTTLQRAIAAKDFDNVTKTAWKNAKVWNNVPVNLEAMKDMQDHLYQMRSKKEGDLFLDTDVEDVNYRIENVGQLMRLAQTDVAGRGFIAHGYAEGRTGRLYAKGVSLQTAPKTIRHTALQGLYDYDIENCHYSIFAQLSARYGRECPAINHYLTHKEEIREKLAQEVDIHPKQVKMALLALMFGARATVRHGNAITDALGVHKARALFDNKTFRHIQADLFEGRKLILDKWPKSRNTIKNDMGKTTRFKHKGGKREKPENLLAHIIQGVEAKALMAAVDLYPEDIVLLMHDGFVSKRKLDIPLIERVVYKATGYRLEFTGQVIVVSADLDFNN